MATAIIRTSALTFPLADAVRRYSNATITNIQNYQPSVTKITQFGTDVPNIGLPLQEQWDSPLPLLVKKISQIDCRGKSIHYFCGGLPALMQAARKVDSLTEMGLKSEKVVYVNDGKTPKTLQSGHQAHVHPSEWASEDCNTWNLFKVFLRGIQLLPQQDPKDVEHYSYLHFPVLEQLKASPLETFKTYVKFFAKRLKQSTSTEHGISPEDHRLCRAVAESLSYHKVLSKRIEQQQGKPTFTECGRAYWSPNVRAMLKKEQTWKKLGIDCYMMQPEAIREQTLLKENSGLAVLKIPNDGKFYPDTSQRIIHYLENNYPQIFSSYTASVRELRIHNVTHVPLNVLETLLNGQKQETAIASFFGSLGHNQVFLEPVFTKDNFLKREIHSKPLWFEVPVSGNSVVWKCTISIQEIKERTKMDPLEYVQSLLPLANLSNLHVTTWEGQVRGNDVILYVRASQGANFNSLVANKNDVLNMAENINRFFIGKWELISLGTCSRKTDISNIPESVELSFDKKYPVTFRHGLSGIGYSFSAAPVEMIQPKMKRRSVL